MCAFLILARCPSEGLCTALRGAKYAWTYEDFSWSASQDAERMGAVCVFSDDAAPGGVQTEISFMYPYLHTHTYKPQKKANSAPAAV